MHDAVATERLLLPDLEPSAGAVSAETGRTAAAGRSATRPELQALRAVAVALIVVFHMWPTVLPGGYVGVDVFFVISGFLITSLLLREVARSGTVGLTQFWARRIRRLLPAAFTVLLASMAAVGLWLPRSAWEQAFQSIGSSAVYGVNWLLAVNSVDYLAKDDKPSIVQHYWSLAVEEQFYIVWPVLILVAIALARWLMHRRKPEQVDHSTSTRVAIAVALGLVALGSLAFSILETARSQPFAYLITPTRAWEFAAGGLLAFVPMGLPSRVPAAMGLVARPLASWAGLAAIGIAALTFSATSPFPGYIAMLPVVGAVLVIWAGDTGRRWAPTAVAGFGPILLVGDLSYSIYLWHWPLIVLYPYLLGHAPELRGGLLIIGATVGLAWLTKRLIEDPVRTREFWTSSRRHSYALAGVGMIATLTMVGGATLQLQQDRRVSEQRVAEGIRGHLECFGAAAVVPGAGCTRPFAVPDGFDTAFGRADKGLLGKGGCRSGQDSTTVVSCAVGDPKGTVGVAVIGNSQGLMLASGLVDYAQENGWRIDTYSRISCLGVALRQVAGYPSATCVSWTKQVIDRLVQDPDVDIVVFQSFTYAPGGKLTRAQRLAFKAAMQATWTRLLDAGKKVAVISDPPGTRPDLAADCVSRAIKEYDPCRRAVGSVVFRNMTFDTAKGFRDVKAVDVSRYFCDRTYCHSVIGGVLVYFDNYHMTHTYSVTLGRIIGKELAGLLQS